MANITGDFNWSKPQVYTSFVQGADAQAIYDSLDGTMKKRIVFDARTNTLIGSNVFVAAKIDTLVKPLGMRVANLRDLSRPEIMVMIKDNFYTNATTLVLRSADYFYERNLPLTEQISQEVERVNGKLQLPVMVTGFDVKSIEDKNGYGIAIVPRDDFKGVHDERLKGDYDRKRFSEVDELGLPKFDRNGSRTWHARDSGLTGLFLYEDLDIGSWDGNLSYSGGDGLVVLVSAEGTAKNLEGKI